MSFHVVMYVIITALSCSLAYVIGKPLDEHSSKQHQSVQPREEGEEPEED